MVYSRVDFVEFYCDWLGSDCSVTEKESTVGALFGALVHADVTRRSRDEESEINIAAAIAIVFVCINEVEREFDDAVNLLGIELAAVAEDIKELVAKIGEIVPVTVVVSADLVDHSLTDAENSLAIALAADSVDEFVFDRSDAVDSYGRSRSIGGVAAGSVELFGLNWQLRISCCFHHEAK